MTDTVFADVQRIADLLRLAREADVAEMEAELPYWNSRQDHGKLTVKARWEK